MIKHKSCLLLFTPVGYRRFTPVGRDTFRKDDPHDDKRSYGVSLK